MQYMLQVQSPTSVIAIISGCATVIVAVLGILGNWYLVNQNKKKELLMKSIEIEQKEYQFLLENLKSFWEYQNGLYSETLKVVSKLVLNDSIKSEEFLEAYKRLWELYWSELPTCESEEIAAAMIAIKDMIYDKKHLDENDHIKIKSMKKDMKKMLLDLAVAVKNSSLLLEYSEKIKYKFRNGQATLASQKTA